MKVEIGGSCLAGTISVQSSKNAGQKIIPATVLVPGITVLEECSLVDDNRALLDMLRLLQIGVVVDDSKVTIDATRPVNTAIPREMTMRTTGSFMLAGALLARFGRATLGAPGGDALGSRPVDYHLAAFEAMGVAFSETCRGYQLALDNPISADFTFPSKTANGTVNACVLATSIPGVTKLRNVDWDPDIADLVAFLRCAGMNVDHRADDSSLIVQGCRAGSNLVSAVEHHMISDRNDAVTLLCAAIAGRGEVVICRVPDGIQPAIELLRNMGANIEEIDDELHVHPVDRLVNVPEVVTAAYPGLSTDWGPMLQALMITAAGQCRFTETVFARRFAHIESLRRLGADIDAIRSPAHSRLYRFRADDQPHTLVIRGVAELTGDTVRANDIRGAAALVIAAIQASGTTRIEGAEHLLRGYELLPERLRSINALCDDISD